MDSKLRLQFIRRPSGQPLAGEVIAYDAGDNGLTIVTVEPSLGFHLRSGFDYEEGRAVIAVIETWRLRGRSEQPEFRVLDHPLSVENDALRRCCLYDHVGRFVELAGGAGEQVAIDGIEQAITDLNPPLRRSPAV